MACHTSLWWVWQTCKLLWLKFPCPLSLRIPCNDENVLYAISLTYSLLTLHLSCSFRQRLCVKGLNTQPSKNACCLFLPKKLSITMSSLAPYSLIVVLYLNSSLVTGCRHGSVTKLWHTSLKRLAVMSLISCWIVGNPPLEQLSAWSTTYVLFPTHAVGR